MALQQGPGHPGRRRLQLPGLLGRRRGRERTVARVDEACSKDTVVTGAAIGHEAVVEHYGIIRAWPTLVNPMRRRSLRSGQVTSGARRLTTWKDHADGRASCAAGTTRR